MSVGQKYGIRNAGYYALRSLRIEKFFAFWGQDLDPFTTPLECGREFRVKFDKVCLHKWGYLKKKKQTQQKTALQMAKRSGF